jgi:hypothetical protein
VEGVPVHDDLPLSSPATNVGDASSDTPSPTETNDVNDLTTTTDAPQSNSIDALIANFEREHPGALAAAEARRLADADCPFEAVTDSRWYAFTRGWKEVPIAWMSKRGVTMNRCAFAAARRRDTIKRRRQRRAAAKP